MSTTDIAERVSSMSAQLQEYLDADIENEEHLDGLEHLDDFLKTLAKRVLLPQSIRCPLVHPSDDGNISLRWSECDYDSYTDVNLKTLNADYMVIDAYGTVDQESYNFKNSMSDWSKFSKKTGQWVRKNC